MNTEQAINSILPKGTRIVSFDYNRRAHNVLVGANDAIAGSPAWGTQINRAFRVSRSGRKYLVGLVRNEGKGRVIKTFALENISNLSLLK